jgi:hypothetical protein
MARSMVRAKAANDWTVSEKVFTGVVHRPRRTRLTRLRTPTRSEAGDGDAELTGAIDSARAQRQ